jgi:hypothetical protein
MFYMVSISSQTLIDKGLKDMKNAYRVVSIWHNGDGTQHKQVEGFYDSEIDAQQAIADEELWKDPNYINCEVYKDY